MAHAGSRLKPTDCLERHRSESQPCSRTGENPPYGMIGRIEETSASSKPGPRLDSTRLRDEDGQPPHLLGRRSFLHLAAGAAALPIVLRHARAQAYPARPITMVVPYSAGGPTDTIARIMAERMRTSLGRIIIVENT